MKISVCTLANGRKAHLAQLVSGLNHSRRPPGELVIAVMQDERHDLPMTGFPTRQVIVGDGVSLAHARNRTAETACGELLVFLAPDCIPHPGLLDDYAAAAAAAQQGVFMGEVAQLPRGATDDGIDFARFSDLAFAESEAPGTGSAQLRECRDHRKFRSLNFALSAALFDELGCFDEGYRGYGGEDMDFSKAIAAAQATLWWVRGAKAYRQYSAHHMLSAQRIESVPAPATRPVTLKKNLILT